MISRSASENKKEKFRQSHILRNTFCSITKKSRDEVFRPVTHKRFGFVYKSVLLILCRQLLASSVLPKQILGMLDMCGIGGMWPRQRFYLNPTSKKCQHCRCQHTSCLLGSTLHCAIVSISLIILAPPYWLTIPCSSFWYISLTLYLHTHPPVWASRLITHNAITTPTTSGRSEHTRWLLPSISSSCVRSTVRLFSSFSQSQTGERARLCSVWYAMPQSVWI